MADDGAERIYPARPLVGVGAVVWDGRRVLLVRRGRPPDQDIWALPGGLVELGETVETALRREVREECGLEIEPGPVLGLFEPIQRDPDGRVRYHYVVIDFLARHVAGDLRSGDDAVDVRWVDPIDLPRYHLKPATHDMLARALALTAGDSSEPGGHRGHRA